MADYVGFELADGTTVYFESGGNVLVTQRSGSPNVSEAGKLSIRLKDIAKAAAEISEDLRENLRPDDVEIEFSIKISAEVGWWFIAKTHGEGAINVRLSWKADDARAKSPLTSQEADDAEKRASSECSTSSTR